MATTNTEWSITKSNECIDSDRIPDHVMLHIFSFIPSIRTRMRLSLVSKRFHRLVHSKAMWKGLSSLRLEMFRRAEVTFNGDIFGAVKRTNAIEVLLNFCHSINQLEIDIEHHFIYSKPEANIAWVEMFVRRFKETNQPVRKLTFRGGFRYIPSIFDALEAKDGKPQAFKIQILSSMCERQVIKAMFSHLKSCIGLTELHLELLADCPIGFGCTFDEDAVAALSAKTSLERLALQLTASDMHPGTFSNISAVANSCPSLKSLHFWGPNRLGYDCIHFINLLSDEAMRRLQYFDLNCIQAFWSQPEGLQLMQLLPDKFPNLMQATVLGINYTCVVALVKSFLAAWKTAVSPKLLTLDLDWIGQASYQSTLFGDLKPFYDRLEIAEDGRYTFVSGTAVLVCKLCRPFITNDSDSFESEDYENYFSNFSDDDG